MEVLSHFLVFKTTRRVLHLRQLWTVEFETKTTFGHQISKRSNLRMAATAIQVLPQLEASKLILFEWIKQAEPMVLQIWETLLEEVCAKIKTMLETLTSICSYLLRQSMEMYWKPILHKVEICSTHRQEINLLLAIFPSFLLLLNLARSLVCKVLLLQECGKRRLLLYSQLNMWRLKYL